MSISACLFLLPRSHKVPEAAQMILDAGMLRAQ